MVAAGIMLHPGTTTADVDLHDGGIWVTNQSANLVGHVNYQSRTLDGGFLANSTSYDILQHEGDVMLENFDQSSLSMVDTAAMAFVGGTPIPDGADTSLSNDLLVVTDPAKGLVWAMDPTALPAFTPDGLEPVHTATPGVTAVAGPDQTIILAEPESGTLTTVELDEQYLPTETNSTEVPQLRGSEELQLAAVGDQAVVLDAARGLAFDGAGRQLDLGGGTSSALHGEQAAAWQGAQLQQSGGASTFAAIATTDALVNVPLDGDKPTVLPAKGGTPAAPVQLDGCTHAAWIGNAQYLRSCEDPAHNLDQELPELSESSLPVFRVNRDNVILNDAISGNVWLVKDDLVLVDNWEELLPPPDETDEEEETADTTTNNTLPDRTEANRPPLAVADEFGVRPGRTTVLPVLDNDSDPDGDVLTSAVRGEQPDIGEVQRIYNGGGLQIRVAEDAQPGTRSFRYQADDGRGGTADADVTLRIRGDDENGAPQQKRKTIIQLEQGKSITRNVLNDWTDPDGDDLYLDEGSAPGDNQVAVRRDGLLTFQDAGDEPGRKDVGISVSDGRSTTEGVVTIDVRPAGSLAPVANADHVSVVAGQDLRISPLENDLDPRGGTLSLARVDVEGQGEAEPDFASNTFVFKAAPVGRYYVTYLVTNGPLSSTGVVRVDVLGSAREGSPVATRDTALLPAGGEVLVDALANDSDPGGGVLVIQGVSAPGNDAISVAVLEHGVIRIQDLRGLAEPTTLSYTISNGSQSAVGEIAVVPVPAPDRAEPPEANRDTARVRAGDIVTIDVLANDTHPNGDRLKLVPELVETVEESAGRLFVSENSLRFIAGAQARTVSLVYEVEDSLGQRDSARVLIHIEALDAEKNDRPNPRHLTARVLSGGTVRIPVPLNGIDPNGDSVSLTGITKAPAQGTALPGSNYIDYIATDVARGTDTFTYSVTDRLGATNTATVRVGIAPAGETNHAPVPVDDVFELRPGRAAALDVLANDTDPDGDRLSLVPDGVVGPQLDAEARQERVWLRTPAEAGAHNVRYRVADGRGGTAVGTATITVDPDAPLQSPIARDDRVEPAEAMGRTAVDVPVLENDEDPDGVADELDVAVDAFGGTATVMNDGVVRVNLTAAPQLVPYTVTDADSLSGTAVIWVPGLGDQFPVLAETAPLEVIAGQSLTLDVADLVRVRTGRTPVITQEDSLRAIGTDGSPLLADPTTLTYTAHPDFIGRGSVTFEVTDGAGPDDPEGLKSTLTVLIDVLADPNRNQPPAMRNGALNVAQGEERQTLDLRELAEDPNQDDVDGLDFSLSGAVPAGFTASIADGRLEAAATGDAAVGATGILAVTVTDPDGEQATAQIFLNVVSSTRPLAVANPDSRDDAVQGQGVTVDVLANDTNPFSSDPLRLVSANVTTGEGRAEVAGDAVRVTPGADFTGVLQVTYTVADRTGQADRQVDGQLQVTVRGRPDVPAQPVVESVEDSSVVLSWAPPNNNGLPITGYTVRAAGFAQECAATTCTLTGLTNNVVYNFAVEAANDAGTSEVSPPSADARPDTRPDKPQPPTLVSGDGSLAVSWAPATSSGSPVESYNVRIAPAPAAGNPTKTGVTGTSLVWEGLQNGQAYTVAVQAVNQAPEPSDFSEPSAPQTPAGLPRRPTAPSAAVVPYGASQSQLSVSWLAPDSNGAPIQQYVLSVFRGGSLQQKLETAGTSQTVTVANADQDYTFAVAAVNKVGQGESSATSPPKRAAGKPGTVSGVKLTAHNTAGDGRQVQASFTALADSGLNGARRSEISYIWTASTGQSGTFSGSGQPEVLAGFTNGVSTSVTVRAVSSASGTAVRGAGATSGSVVPYGKPLPPRVQGHDAPKGSQDVKFIWETPVANGKDVDRIEWRHIATTYPWDDPNPDRAGDLAPRAGSKTIKTSWDNSTTLEFRVCDVTHVCSDGVMVHGRTGPAPGG
ncbi:Ig-like domain-containing protein [Arthrobacter crystallopoietes]|uniref:Ig-like domain-containing protein n=1 Tax=Crystallibacter crystallopoietes TaxID=37928 RepID=UPI00111122D8|nr:Ig-like domain-containing protein [Arthrobacter crystallopoietes]